MRKKGGSTCPNRLRNVVHSVYGDLRLSTFQSTCFVLHRHIQKKRLTRRKYRRCVKAVKTRVSKTTVQTLLETPSKKTGCICSRRHVRQGTAQPNGSQVDKNIVMFRVPHQQQQKETGTGIVGVLNAFFVHKWIGESSSTILVVKSKEGKDEGQTILRQVP